MQQLERLSTRVEELQANRKAKHCTAVHCFALTEHTKKLDITRKQTLFTAFQVSGVCSGEWKWSKPSMD